MSLFKAYAKRERGRYKHTVLQGPARKCPDEKTSAAVRARVAPYGIAIHSTTHVDGSKVYEVYDQTGAERFISQDWPNVVEEANQLVMEAIVETRNPTRRQNNG